MGGDWVAVFANTRTTFMHAQLAVCCPLRLQREEETNRERGQIMRMAIGL